MLRLAVVPLALVLAGATAFACSYATTVWEPSSDADPPYYSIWGVEKPIWIDRSGRRIPFTPRRLLSDSDGLEPYQQGDLFGYSRGGKPVIPPRFLKGEKFSEGRAIVVLQGPCAPPHGGVCGEPVLLPTSAIPHSIPRLDIQSGRWRPVAPACQYTFINELGEILGTTGFSDAAAFSESMAPVRIDRFWGYVDLDLSIVVPPRYLGARAFSEGLAAVLGSDGFFYIDQAGTARIPGPFEGAGEFHEGVAVVYQNQSSYYINRAGRHAVPGTFAYAGRFFHGRANVQFHDGTLAYIDRAGRVVYRWKPH